MMTYYIRDSSNRMLIRNDATGFDWVPEIGRASIYHSYGEAQIDAKTLRDKGFWVSVIDHVEALHSINRLHADLGWS